MLRAQLADLRRPSAARADYSPRTPFPYLIRSMWPCCRRVGLWPSLTSTDEQRQILPGRQRAKPTRWLAVLAAGFIVKSPAMDYCTFPSVCAASCRCSSRTSSVAWSRFTTRGFAKLQRWRGRPPISFACHHDGGNCRPSQPPRGDFCAHRAPTLRPRGRGGRPGPGRARRAPRPRFWQHPWQHRGSTTGIRGGIRGHAAFLR